MKRIILTFALLAGVLTTFNFHLSTILAQTNVLSIGDVNFPAGKTAIIPIELTNQSDICGVQFEIGLSYQLSTVTDEETGTSKLPFYLNQSRAGGCDLSVRSLSSSTTYMYYNGGTSIYKYVYRVMITSTDNRPIKGSSGTLLTIEMPLPENLENGAQIWSMLRDNKIILSDREGKQVASSTVGTAGIITVEVIPRPDLVPSNVAVTQSIASPGDQLDFTWKVENVGDTATSAGWTEKIYLENEAKTRVYVGTTAYERTLAENASVDRSFSINLDDFPGISGNCRPVVQILPSAGCGEIPLNQGNNTAVGKNYSLYVKKFLILTPYKNVIPEKGTGTYNCELRRTGDLSEAQTFKVTTRDASGNKNRLIASDAKFTAQSNKTYISLQPVNNTSINPDQRVAVVVNEPLNNGYGCVIDSVLVEDDDLIPLTLTLDKSEYNEGEVIHVTATVPERYYPNEDLNVYLTIEQPKRFKLPQRITFAPGATTATVDIPVLQDKTPANVQAVKLTGTADRHQKAEVLFILNDDDTPAIEMTLTPTTVSEGAGPSAMLGTITRTGVTNNQITIKLSDDGKGDIYYSTTSVKMPAGTTTVNFPLGVRDNAKVDGDRTVNVTAAIYISSCNCDAIGDKQTSVTIPITITDDDGAALSVTTNKATILEGDATGATLTISRNTTDNAEPLTVTITHDGTDVTCPATATIPAGATSVTVPFVALSNSLEEGDRTVSITVSAEGYSTGSAWLLISDRTLPDVLFERISLSRNEVAAGDTVAVRMEIRNIGAASFPQGATLQVLQNGTVVNTQQTPKVIAVGETQTFTAILNTSDIPAEYTISAQINPQKTLPELLYVNNSSESLKLSVQSLYTFTISADKSVYNEGENVTLSGKVTAVGNAPVADLHIEPYVIFNGSRTKLDCLTDAQGNFTVLYQLPASYRGHFTYGVCNVGEELTTEAGAFNVYGFERTSTSYIKHQIFKGEPYQGTISLRNLTSLPLHHVTPVLSGATGNYLFEIGSIDELPGDSIRTVNYTITGKEATSGKGWEIITIKFTTDEGATLSVNTYNFTQLHTPKLVASTTSINTTVTKGISRTYPIELTNAGLAETGKISIDLPTNMGNFISLATPAEMGSMQPGDSATIMLRFTAGDELDVNLIQKGSLAINCENGNYVRVNFNVKVVSESKGALRVQVRDENTIYGNKDGEHPYVKGAQVQLKDYNTGAVITQGTIPDETDAGILFENLNEGYYQLLVTADKHDSYRQNIVVSPGDTTVHLATISYQAVSVTWDVVETEVEDEYEVVTTVQYETMVPVPVIRMTAPKQIEFDKIMPGYSTLFNIVLRNDGLIAAQKCYVNLPSVKGYLITPLVEASDFILGAQQSYTIPVRITRTATNVKFGPNDPNFNGGSGDGGSTGGGGDTGGGDTGGGDTGGNGSTGSGGGSGDGGGSDDGDGSGKNSGYVPCSLSVSAGGSWQCGDQIKSTSIGQSIDPMSSEARAGGGCSGSSSSSSTISRPGAPSGGPGDPINGANPVGGSGGGELTGGKTYPMGCGAKCPDWDIEPCLGFIPQYDCVSAPIHALSAGVHYYMGDKEYATNQLEKARDQAVTCVLNNVKHTKKLAGKLIPAVTFVQCLGTAFDAAQTAACNAFTASSGTEPGGMSPIFAPRRKMTVPNLLVSFYNKAVPLATYQTSAEDYFNLRFGAPEMLDNAEDEMTQALLIIDDIIDELDSKDQLLTIDPMAEIPEVGTPENKDSYGFLAAMPNMQAKYYDFDVRKHVLRRINTIKKYRGLDYDQQLVINIDSMKILINRMDSCEQAMVDMGFAEWNDLIQSANADMLRFTTNVSTSTCATVKLEIEQKLVLTRQAFRGTLTVDNALSTALNDIELNVIVENLLGEQVTSHEFQINFEKIEGFTGNVEGPWSLAPNTKGIATVLFIPTKYAAPDSLTTYAFGGNLSWSDGSTYQNRALSPVSLQVKPSPELNLTYFMQRDIYGDNPLTEEVEPIIPSEFTVLIHNKGKGEATNVRMMTKQPKIVENAKGLLADFAIVSSSLNGGEKAMALDSLIATQFGNIPAGGSSYATWNLTCPLLGHFTSYDVSVTHVTSYGNPDLSLLDEVTIHELIHSVNARFGEQQYRAWVCNDVEDGYAEPDHIYFSNGEDEDLKTLSTVTTVTALGNSKWRVQVVVPQREWFYTAVADPTGGSSKILSIMDETTGESVDPENFWTTQWTMQNGFDPLRENKLHIVDFAEAPKTFSYVVTFEPTPEVRLDVVSIETVPDEDSIAETVIDSLIVTFNKAIDATTFTRDDIVLSYEGEKRATDLPITMVKNDSIFRLNTSALSENGYYVLQVKTDSIRDKEGFLGYNGKQVKWMLFKDGLVHYNVAPWPSTGGVVETSTTKTDGNCSYGQYITMTATANEGYTFTYWATAPTMSTTGSGARALRVQSVADADVDEDQLERFSTDPTITLEMTKAYNLYAVFKPNTYMVNIVMPTAVGEISVGSGLYNYGTVLSLKATANEGFRILGFIVNDDEAHKIEGDEYEFTVTGDATIVVDYKDFSPVSVILQDTKDYTPEAIELANVKLQRSFHKGLWNTICLPCDVSKPEEVFGAGTQVARLTAIEGCMMIFETVSQMEANVPYLIKPGTLNNNALVADGEAKTSLYDIVGTSIEEPDAEGPVDKKSQGIDFVGSYQDILIPSNAGNYYLNNDFAYYVGTTAAVPSGRFRGYFHTDRDDLSKQMYVIVDEEVVTAIIDADPRGTNIGAVYSIDGKQVRAAGSKNDDLRHLPAGVYLIGKNKVIIK